MPCVLEHHACSETMFRVPEHRVPEHRVPEHRVPEHRFRTGMVFHVKRRLPLAACRLPLAACRLFCVSRETAFAECRLPRVSRETRCSRTRKIRANRLNTQDSCQSLEHARFVPIRRVFHVKQHSAIMPEPLPNTPFRRNANIFWGPMVAT